MRVTLVNRSMSGIAGATATTSSSSGSSSTTTTATTTTGTSANMFISLRFGWTPPPKEPHPLETAVAVLVGPDTDQVTNSGTTNNNSKSTNSHREGGSPVSKPEETAGDNEAAGNHEGAGELGSNGSRKVSRGNASALTAVSADGGPGSPKGTLVVRLNLPGEDASQTGTPKQQSEIEGVRGSSCRTSRSSSKCSTVI